MIMEKNSIQTMQLLDTPHFLSVTRYVTGFSLLRGSSVTVEPNVTDILTPHLPVGLV